MTKAGALPLSWLEFSITEKDIIPECPRGR